MNLTTDLLPTLQTFEKVNPQHMTSSSSACVCMCVCVCVCVCAAYIQSSKGKREGYRESLLILEIWRCEGLRWGGDTSGKRLMPAR